MKTQAEMNTLGARLAKEFPAEDSGVTIRVQQRTHEIGIRMALGAQRRDLLRLILGGGTIKELADEYLTQYKLRHKSVTFAEYAVGNVTRNLGEHMAVEMADTTVMEYQSIRLKENAAPKTINEEVGFLLRLLGDAGDAIRGRMRRERTLKLKVRNQIGKAYTPEQRAAMVAAAGQSRSPAIRPALMLALNAGMRDAEIRWLQLVTVGAS